MTLAACIDLVARGDPERHQVTRGAGAAAQARLYPLYALNLEVARAPWVTAEALIAEMRLQWWRDTVAEIAAGAAPRAHEVVVPLAGVMREAALPPGLLDGMIAARAWDVRAEPFADAAGLWDHLDATAGNLMWLAALALGAPEAAEPVVRDFAAGAGLAAWLRAVPELVARGRVPLPDAQPEAVAALAREGLGRMARARARRRAVPPACLPALLTGWEAGAVLHMAARAPERVAQGALTRAEAARRGGLAWRALSGRW